MKSLVPFILVWLVGCAGSRSAVRVDSAGLVEGQGLGRAEELFPEAKRAISISAKEDDRPSLLALARQFAESTGIDLQMSQDTERQLAATSVVLGASTEIQSEDVYAFVEALFLRHRFVTAIATKGKPLALGLFSLNGPEAGAISGWSTVAAADLPSFAEHPSLLVQTVVDVRPLDCRALSTTFRQLLREASYQVMLPAGDTNAILRGTVRDVMDWAALIEKSRTLERESREAAPSSDASTPARQ